MVLDLMDKVDLIIATVFIKVLLFTLHSEKIYSDKVARARRSSASVCLSA